MTLVELHSLTQRTIAALVEDAENMVVGVRTTPHYCFCVRVQPDDVARVVGRHGNTIRAIRTIVRAAALQMGMEIAVCVGELGAV